MTILQRIMAPVYRVFGLNQQILNQFSSSSRYKLGCSLIYFLVMAVAEAGLLSWLVLDSFRNPNGEQILFLILIVVGTLLFNGTLLALSLQSLDEVVITESRVKVNLTSLIISLSIIAVVGYGVSMAAEMYVFRAQIRKEYELMLIPRLEAEHADRFEEIKDSLRAGGKTMINNVNRLDVPADEITTVEYALSVAPFDTITHFYSSKIFNSKVAAPLRRASPAIQSFILRADSSYKYVALNSITLSNMGSARIVMDHALNSYDEIVNEITVSLSYARPDFIDRMEALAEVKSRINVLSTISFFIKFITWSIMLIPVFIVRGISQEYSRLKEERHQQALKLELLQKQKMLDQQAMLEQQQLAAKQKDEIEKKEHQELLNKKLVLLDEELKRNQNNLELLVQKLDILKELNRDDFYAVAAQVKIIKDRQSIERSLQYDIKLKRLELVKMKFFGSTTWDFEEGSNILLGKNGYGKTHLLTLIVALLQRNANICKEFFPPDASPDCHAKLTVTITEGNETHDVVIEYSKSGYKEESDIISILSISELRFIDKSVDTIAKPNAELDFVYNPSDHFMRRLPLGEVLAARLYSLCLDLASGHDATELMQILKDVFARLTGSEFSIVEAKREDTSFRLMVVTPGTVSPLPIQKTSQGTLSVLSMIMLVYKYLEATNLEQRDGRKTAEGAGIVLIDEIDAHLHPSWQQKLIGIFRDVFPNVQFIIASHSPMVVGGSKENEVNVLRKAESEGFVVQQIRHHFIGVKPEELYRTIFEVEGKDETYLKYAAMLPQKEKFVEEIRAIEETKQLKGSAQRNKFAELMVKASELEGNRDFLMELKEKPERNADEDTMLNELYNYYKLTPSSSLEDIEEKVRLSHEESEQLDGLMKQQQLDESSRHRLDKLKK